MPSTAHARAGLTLIELLLVMGLLALLFGIGLGMFTALDLESRATVASVQNALRTANHWAVVRGAPARVRIEAEDGRLWPEGLVVVGTWHFERLPLVGAFGLDGGGEDVELSERGGASKALKRRGQARRALVAAAGVVEGPQPLEPFDEDRADQARRRGIRPGDEQPQLGLAQPVAERPEGVRELRCIEARGHLPAGP